MTGDPAARTDFEDWLTREFAERGHFTALVILVGIGETAVTPMCSTYVNVIGDEVAWADIVLMFEGAGQPWDGACFYPRRDPDGRPLSNPAARILMRELESRLDDDRLVLNEGNFFDRWGRRMRIDEVTPG